MADKRHLSLLALTVVPVPAPNRTNMQLADRNESTASAVWLPSADAVDDKVSWSPHNTLTTQIKQARWVTALWISHGFRFHNSAHLHLPCLCDAIKISGFVARRTVTRDVLWLPAHLHVGNSLTRQLTNVFNQSINRSLSVTLLFLWVSAKLFCFELSEALTRGQD